RAASQEKGDIRLLAVTVLTSMDRSDLRRLGIDREPSEVVVDRALAAREAGCDGVISSGQEAAALRQACGPDFLIVCPGIRPAGPAGDDQKRVMDVPGAFAAGASHIVVGRPIRQAADPVAAAEAMQAQIRAHFAKSTTCLRPLTALHKAGGAANLPPSSGPGPPGTHNDVHPPDSSGLEREASASRFFWAGPLDTPAARHGGPQARSARFRPVLLTQSPP